MLIRTILSLACLAAAIFSVGAYAQKASRKPADISVESLEWLEDDPEPPAAAPVRTAVKKKTKKKPAPTRAKGAVFETGKVYARLLRDERKFGQIYFGGTFPVFADFSMFMASTFKSAPSSNSEADMQGYTLGLYLYSPHWHNLGVVAHNSDGTKRDDRQIRGGLYYKLFIPSKNFSLGFVPSIFPAAEHTNLGRFIAHYVLDFRRRIGVTGTFTYVRMKKTDTMTTTPLLYLELMDGLRLLGGYNWTSEDVPMRTGWQGGVQITNTF